MKKELQEILSDENRITQISKYFIEKVDINRKGYISKSEFKEFFEEVAEELDTQISASELEEIFLEVDEGSNMKITYEEIKNMIKQILGYLCSESGTDF